MLDRVIDAGERALNHPAALPVAIVGLLIWQAVVLFVFLADYPLLFGDSPIYLVNGLRPFELDWRNLAGMHPHPIANPGVLLYPFLKAAGCEWGGGDIAACSLGFKAYIVPASVVPLVALYWFLRRWVSPPWAIGAMLATGAVSYGYYGIIFMSVSTTLAFSATLVMFRAGLELPEHGRRRDWILVCAMPVVVATTSASVLTAFVVATAVACTFRITAWRTLAPPLILGAAVSAIINWDVYTAVWRTDAGRIVEEGLVNHLGIGKSAVAFHGGLYYTFGAIFAAVALLSKPHRPLSFLTLALYVCASLYAHDQVLANLWLRSSQLYFLLSIGMALIGIDLICKLHVRMGRKTLFACVAFLLFAMTVPYPFASFINARDSRSVDVALIARDFSESELEPVVWIFPSWHEAVLYGTLYERDGQLHSAYAISGIRELALAARTAIGTLGGEFDRREAIASLGATHIFAIERAEDQLLDDWKAYIRAMAVLIASHYGEPEQCGTYGDGAKYCIYRVG